MKIKGYDARDKNCVRRWCWSPGRYEHRGAMLSGSRNTGNYSLECMHRAYHGCPRSIIEQGEKKV